MIKVKTFGEPLQPFKAHQELDELDERVNSFIVENKIKKVVSLSDTATTENGSTIGLRAVKTKCKKGSLTWLTFLLSYGNERNKCLYS